VSGMGRGGGGGAAGGVLVRLVPLGYNARGYQAIRQSNFAQSALGGAIIAHQLKGGQEWT